MSLDKNVFGQMVFHMIILLSRLIYTHIHVHKQEIRLKNFVSPENRIKTKTQSPIFRVHCDSQSV